MLAVISEQVEEYTVGICAVSSMTGAVNVDRFCQERTEKSLALLKSHNLQLIPHTLQQVEAHFF